MTGPSTPTRPLRTASSGGSRGGAPPSGPPSTPTPPPHRESTARAVIGFIGRALITLGLVVLLFVGYQLWGTGYLESRQQNSLETQFEDRLAEVEADIAGGAETEPAAAATEPVPVAEGDAALEIEIPEIGVDKIVVEGVSIPDLRKGPGHYPDTPMPGEIGNAAIAGHRTTYGQPFHDLDKLEDGDEIVTRTLSGTFTYEVIGTEVVAPAAVDVLAPPAENTYVAGKPHGDAIITLTTCNPKYSAAERLVVWGALKTDVSPEALPPSVDADLSTGRTALDEAGLSGESSNRLPLALAILVVVVVGGLWWLAFRRWRHWYTWFLGVVPFLASLAVLFFYVERLLPANY